MAPPALLVTLMVPMFCSYSHFCSICGLATSETRVVKIPYSILETEHPTDWNRWYRENIRGNHRHRWSLLDPVQWRSLFGTLDHETRTPPSEPSAALQDTAGKLLDELALNDLDLPYFRLLSHREANIRSIAVQSYGYRPTDMTDEAAVQQWWQDTSAWALLGQKPSWK